MVPVIVVQTALRRIHAQVGVALTACPKHLQIELASGDGPELEPVVIEVVLCEENSVSERVGVRGGTAILEPKSGCEVGRAETSGTVIRRIRGRYRTAEIDEPASIHAHGVLP